MTATAPRSGALEIGVRFGVDQTVLAARGDVDVLAAPTLGAVLDVLVDQGHEHVVLDCATVTFMDAAGLGVIAHSSARLATSNRMLTLRALPSQVRRILDMTGLTDLIRLEASDPNVAVLGTEELPADRPLAVAGKRIDLTADLTRVGSKPNNATIDAALLLVTLLAGATVEGADGVSVTLERNGRLATVASTNDTVRLMDGHQYETGEGPCLAAAAQGHWFHSESLADEDRWPAFVPRAIEEGIASILSTPLMTAERAVGALNIYSNTERAFGPRQQELAALFATQASGILIDGGTDAIDEKLGERILEGLHARQMIARAEGVLMARDHVSAERATATLHRAARTAEAAVLAHATEIVASTHSQPGPDT